MELKVEMIYQMHSNVLILHWIVKSDASSDGFNLLKHLKSRCKICEMKSLQSEGFHI